MNPSPTTAQHAAIPYTAAGLQPASGGTPTAQPAAVAAS
jgi:hypothetical protein